VSSKIIYVYIRVCVCKYSLPCNNMAQMPQDNGGKNSKLRFLPLSHEDRPQIRLPPRPRSPPRKITLKSSLDIDHVSNRIITPKRKSREPSNNPRRAVHAHRRNPTVSPQQPCPSLSFEHAETYGDNDGLQYEEDKISDAGKYISNWLVGLGLTIYLF